MRESVARRDWARFRKWRKGLQTTSASTKNIPMGMTPYPQVLESEDAPSVLVDSEWWGVSFLGLLGKSKNGTTCSRPGCWALRYWWAFTDPGVPGTELTIRTDPSPPINIHGAATVLKKTQTHLKV